MRRQLTEPRDEVDVDEKEELIPIDMVDGE